MFSRVSPKRILNSIRPVTGGLSRFTRSLAKHGHLQGLGSPEKKDCSFLSNPGGARGKNIPRPSAMPMVPPVEEFAVPTDKHMEYAIVVSMYEVYNDRIFDLLSKDPSNNKIKNPNQKRRALLFKITEQSPEQKVVAGLTKVICGCLEEALVVLETGLMERKIADTRSNAVSSRSHGFFCIEVKKRDSHRKGPWSSSTLTVVDLAGELSKLEMA